jgi:hypothetical protein
MKSHRLSATLVLALLALAPLALAQTAKPKKKGAKPADSAAAASASASASASAPDTSALSNAPAAAPTPSAAPSSSAGGKDLPDTPPDAAPLATDTTEVQGKKYYFVGARYRGNLIPQFLENLFVNDGATLYSNSFAIELDMRSDGHSTIPWIGYANYDTGDILFYQKGKPDDPANYSDVKSRLGAIYLGLDEMWSTPLDEAHHWDFEYGFGVGIGVLFGTLYNNWVYIDPNGPLAGTNGKNYSGCASQSLTMTQIATNNGENPCTPGAHNNSQDIKVGGYQEKNWFSGGSVPVIFPHIAFPQFSIRYKPVKSFEARLGLGFSITGFWFGLSGDYGLEQPAEAPPANKNGGLPNLRSTL